MQSCEFASSSFAAIGLTRTATFTLTDMKMQPSDIYPEQSWPGGYVNLPYGKTHYYLMGPENGQKVLFVHGISTPAPFFRTFIDLLATKYLVLCYDLYGRGYSDSPAVDYNEHLYVAQLALLVHKLKWDRFNLIGYSLGGAISTLFTEKYPESVDRLVLIASAGLLPSLSLNAQIVKIPILGWIFFMLLYFFIMQSQICYSAKFTTEPYAHSRRV